MANQSPISENDSSVKEDVRLVPDWVLNTQTVYQHVGNDLLILRADGIKIFIKNYFTQHTFPRLVTESGQSIAQESIDFSLALTDIAYLEDSQESGASKLDIALATGENVDEVLTEIFPDSNGNKEASEAFYDSFQAAILNGQPPNSALKSASVTLINNLSIQQQSQTQSNPSDNLLLALANGELSGDSLDLEAMSPEQVAQFSETLADNLASGISIENSLNEATAIVHAEQTAQRTSATPSNSADSLLNTLATGESVTQVLSEYSEGEAPDSIENFQTNLVQALNSESSLDEALIQAQESNAVDALEIALTMNTPQPLMLALASGENISEVIATLAETSINNANSTAGNLSSINKIKIRVNNIFSIMCAFGSICR